jgi:outer membrane protein assembly factor BamB
MGRRRTWVIAGASVLVVGIVAAAVGYHFATQRVGDVRNGDAVPFTTTADPPPPPPPTTTVKKGPDFGEPWPFYGRTLSRTRDATDLSTIRPPYKTSWSKIGGGLLEYPPTYADGVLYELSDAGTATAYNVFTGRVLWRKHLRAGSSLPALGSPAIGGKFVYMPAGSGLDALRRSDGSLAWKLRTTSALEGSPAVWHGVVYIGKLSGAMVAVSAQTGHVLWTYATSGAVKHGPALVDGRLYFGDYAGVMYCLDASSGRLIWRKQTAGLSSGYRSGGFYSTPAVAYGRVYVGNTDGKVYSFDASNGEEAWSTTLPGWAYGSPAVADGRVFATSSLGTFVALNARTGVELWRHQLPYNTLSSPVVIGPLVYVSDRGASGSVPGHAYGYNPGSGQLVWQFHDGKYSTAIAAAGRLIVVGFGRLYSLKPRG